MKPFTFSRATDLRSAVPTEPNTTVIAGGTNLLDLMKKHIQQPDALVDITAALPTTIERDGKAGLRIGAMARNTAVATHPLVTERYPLLAQAILQGASPQIRNMASTGGNLMQRTRCPYFYDPALPCNKRAPGSGCGALRGHHRTAAVIGYSEACVAVHPSDMCVALVALDAQVEITDGNNVRMMPFAEFHRLPSEAPERDNNLPAGHLIQAVRLPDNDFADHSAYVKVRDRDSYAFALVSVAAALEIKRGKIKQARLASGGVAHKPWRWLAAEQFLRKQSPSVAVFERAADLALADAQPLTDNAYKIPMLRGSIITALKQASGI